MTMRCARSDLTTSTRNTWSCRRESKETKNQPMSVIGTARAITSARDQENVTVDRNEAAQGHAAARQSMRSGRRIAAFHWSRWIASTRPRLKTGAVGDDVAVVAAVAHTHLVHQRRSARRRRNGTSTRTRTRTGASTRKIDHIDARKDAVEVEATARAAEVAQYRERRHRHEVTIITTIRRSIRTMG